EKNAARSLFLQQFVQLSIYKRSQGRIARQVTFGALAIVVLLAAWRLSTAAMNWRGGVFGEENDHPVRFWFAGGGAGARHLCGVSRGESAELRRLFDRRRSGDEQGLLADANRAVSQLAGGDPAVDFSGCCAVRLRRVLANAVELVEGRTTGALAVRA